MLLKNLPDCKTSLKIVRDVTASARKNRMFIRRLSWFFFVCEETEEEVIRSSSDFTELRTSKYRWTEKIVRQVIYFLSLDTQTSVCP